MSSSLLQAEWFAKSLHEQTNTLMSGDIHVIGGRTKEGKSTFVENCVEGWVHQGYAPVWAITEMTRAETIDRRAAAAIGLPYDQLRRRNWSALPYDAEKRFLKAQADVETLLKHCRIIEGAILTPKAVLEQVKDSAGGIYILDSITQVTFDGMKGKKNELIELLVSRIKESVIKYNVIGVTTSQFGRDDYQGSTMFQRPQTSWFQGSSRIEQICSQALGVTRAVKQGLSPIEFLENIRAIKSQQKNKDIMYEPNATRVHIMLHRDKSGSTGSEVDLFYWHGRLSDMAHAEQIKADPTFRVEKAEGPDPWDLPAKEAA